MVSIKSEHEIELMKHSGHINYLCHKLLEKNIRPGITTGELESIAKKFMEENGCISSTKGYEGYPGYLCISINDEVVHGIPGKRKLKNGDIVKLDISMIYKGYHSYKSISLPFNELGTSFRNILVGTIIKERISICNSYYIATFIIPKGSEYYENKCGEIVSSSIIYTGKYVKI